jgi:acyl dehydratase
VADTTPIETIDEFEEEYRKGAGQALPGSSSKEANLDNIRRCGDGIGDHNPLYRDPEHAAKSRFGTITAMPTFVYSVSLGAGAAINGAINPARVGGFAMNYAGGELEIFRPIWLGDTITIHEQVGPVVRKESGRIGPFCICTGLVTYTNQRHEVVATKRTLMARYKILDGGEGAIAYDREHKTDVQQESPDPLVWEQERRGAETRYWEDIVEGEEMAPLKKGTYTVNELFLFTFGAMGTRRGTRASLGGRLESHDRFDAEHAKKRRSMPGQFDFGPQRVCWLIQMATDWMGDDGTLKKLVTQVRHPNIVGDTNTIYGNVASKYVQGDEHLVDLDIRNVNQSGTASAFSRATVALPSRG